jgi:uncharacterized protein (DUF4415 family)
MDIKRKKIYGADILAWLRNERQEGYQSRLNALLRSVMLRDLEAKRKRA